MTREEATEALLMLLRYEDDPVKYLALKMVIKALEQPEQWDEMLVMCDNCGHAIHVKRDDVRQPEPCEDAVSRNAIIRKLNTMDRYVSDELTFCDTDKKFPKNEVFVVDDVYEEIVEQLPSVTPKPIECEDAVSREAVEEMLKGLMPERGMWEIEGDEAKTAVCETVFDAMSGLSKLPSVIPKLPDSDDSEVLYCDRDICLRNDYNGIGCGDCEVTKSQQSRR